MKLDTVRRFALSLPETTEQPHFELTSFRVAGKIFATAPPGAGLLHVFVEEAERVPLVAASPEVFEDLHWGKSVCGVRVKLQKADKKTVERLLLCAWKRKAPKRLLG
jgi:hypothetical protein